MRAENGEAFQNVGPLPKDPKRRDWGDIKGRTPPSREAPYR